MDQNDTFGGGTEREDQQRDHSIEHQQNQQQQDPNDPDDPKLDEIGDDEVGDDDIEDGDESGAGYGDHAETEEDEGGMSGER